MELTTSKGFAMVATTVLFLSRFPPEGSKRIDEDHDDEEVEGEQTREQ